MRVKALPPIAMSCSSTGTDPSRRRDVDPRVWGPAAWSFLHAVGHSYPDAPSEVDRQRMHQFLETLAYALPCASCRGSYAPPLSVDGDTSGVLSSRRGLSEWLVRLHNHVNHRHHKRSNWTLEEAENTHVHRGPRHRWDPLVHVLGAVCIILLVTAVLAICCRRC